jgi:hypothetical protein
VTAEKSNQGMRQPQMGGVQSRLDLGSSVGPICGHKEMWRLEPGSKWVCAVCHPPPRQKRFENVERRTVEE